VQQLRVVVRVRVVDEAYGETRHCGEEDGDRETRNYRSLGARGRGLQYAPYHHARDHHEAHCEHQREYERVVDLDQTTSAVSACDGCDISYINIIIRVPVRLFLELQLLFLNFRKLTAILRICWIITGPHVGIL
jgi:hypothetical protein